MEYENLYKSEGYGAFSLGIEINISSPIGRENEALRIATYKAVEIIEEEIKRQFHKTNKESIERAKKERVDLLNCFPSEPIFVKEIPNGYCSRACCEHLKWYSVATKIGMVKIGWRKRVINIDWSETDVRRFVSNDDVTKSETYIHAWGYEKATEYLRDLLNK